MNQCYSNLYYKYTINKAVHGRYCHAVRRSNNSADFSAAAKDPLVPAILDDENDNGEPLFLAQSLPPPVPRFVDSASVIYPEFTAGSLLLPSPSPTSPGRVLPAFLLLVSVIVYPPRAPPRSSPPSTSSYLLSYSSSYSYRPPFLSNRTTSVGRLIRRGISNPFSPTPTPFSSSSGADQYNPTLSAPVRGRGGGL